MLLPWTSTVSASLSMSVMAFPFAGHIPRILEEYMPTLLKDSREHYHLSGESTTICQIFLTNTLIG